MDVTIPDEHITKLKSYMAESGHETVEDAICALIHAAYNDMGKTTHHERRIMKPKTALMTALAERDNGMLCRCCGTTKNLSIDHIVPLANDGTDDFANLQILCRSCNSTKGNRHATRY